jgi:hypothetical protein
MRSYIQRCANRNTQRLGQVRFLAVNARQHIDDKVMNFENEAIGHITP